MKYELTPNQEDKQAFIKEIQKHFSNSNQSIHKARNEIKIITYNGKKQTIKSFKIPHIINKIAYTFFRPSKAKKSFQNALKILDFTPQPIGYIEFFKFGLLSKSYFVSEYFDYDFTIREPLLDKKYPNRVKIFQEFTKFTFLLHQSRIFHKDYSPGNILVKEENGTYIFKIVDINRMYFTDFTTKERLENFAKLGASDEDLKIMIQEYAMLLGVDLSHIYQEATKYSKLHQDRIRMKQKIKKVFK